MNKILEKALAGGLSGAASAFWIDWGIFWSRDDKSDPFNWEKALKRWAAGFVSGALAGLGFGQVS